MDVLCTNRRTKMNSWDHSSNSENSKMKAKATIQNPSNLTLGCYR